jgi:hypothetical protein
VRRTTVGIAVIMFVVGCMVTVFDVGDWVDTTETTTVGDWLGEPALLGCMEGVALLVDKDGAELSTANGASLGIGLADGTFERGGEGDALAVGDEAALGCIEGVALVVVGSGAEVGVELRASFGGIEEAALVVGEPVIMFVVGCCVTSIETAGDGDVLGVALCEGGDVSVTICIVGAAVVLLVGEAVTMFEVGDVVAVVSPLTGQSKVSGIAGQSQSQVDAESEKQQSGTPFGAVSQVRGDGVVDCSFLLSFPFNGTLRRRLGLLLRDEIPLH